MQTYFMHCAQWAFSVRVTDSLDEGFVWFYISIQELISSRSLPLLSLSGVNY